MDDTGKALVAHWAWAAEKGLMNPSTARLLQNACLQVLSAVFSGEWESANVRALEIDDVFRRFQNLKGRSLTPRSLQDYRRRFTQALESFCKYLDDPSAWVAPGQDKSSRSDVPSSGERVRERKARTTRPTDHGEALIEYPFPIREFTARLILPRELTSLEARRLSAFIASLATDFGDLRRIEATIDER